MPLTLVRTSDPSTEPLTTAEAKNHLRVDTSADDLRIEGLVTAAREHVEEVTRRALITQTWELSLDDFPDGRRVHRPEMIRLPRSPVQSVDNIEYVDTGGVTQTLDVSRYRADLKSEPARITEAEGEYWPITDGVTNAVTITFKAGYGDAESDVPQAIREAMKLHIELLYDRPEEKYAAQLERSRDSLLSPYRVFL